MNLHIAAKFQVNGRVTDVGPFGSGHINETYSVCINGNTKPAYVLQKVNINVFPDIEKLSDNILRTTNHLLAAKGNFKVMTLIPTIDNKLWYRTNDGQTWRMLTFIKGSISYDLAPNSYFAYQAGLAYGWFIKTLSSLAEPRLHEIIPGFHSLKLRIHQLNQAIIEDSVNRLHKCNPVVDFYVSRSNEMEQFDGLVGTPAIPLRITHNDTKINNVLFDKNGKAISVIDLDTVMPGVVHYDFGDAIRTIAATALEDETNLELVGINLDLYKSFANGFLQETRQILTSSEMEYLPIAPRIMAYIMGIRFLADYLRGDSYYKVKNPEHNIQRATNQMTLIADMERKRDKMQLL